MCKKGTKLYSILRFKCPRCHKGDLFVHATYNLRQFQEMHKNCSQCGLRYMSEPSFFDGALYISYALQVALIISVFVALNVLGLAELWIILTLSIGLSLVLIPVTYRLSRSTYINIFVKYSPHGKSDS